MICPKCQADNRDGAKFCNDCGSRLDVCCPNCGNLNRTGSRFCGECGRDLRETGGISTIDYDRPRTYTPKFLADKILTNRSAIEGERKLVTVLFADLANYTAMAEKLDPEEVHAIMDGCFKILMDEIHKYEGTINQFTGDGVMALFGAPVAHEDHAQRACYAALAIRQAISGYGEKIMREYDTVFQMRMGINSGPVIVGAIGDDLRMDYTAVGDTTNLAARMEDLADPGTILVSQHTYKLARHFFELEPVGEIAVKGKAEAQPTYRLLQASEVKTRISASVSKGLTRFVGRRREMAALKEAFDKAAAGSGQVVGISGEAGVGKSRLLIELQNMLSSEQYTYLEGRCLHFGGAMPYLPLLDILRSFFGIKEGEREAIIRKNVTKKVLALDENLKPVLPPFQDLLSLKVQDEAYLKLEPRQKRERIFEALRDLFIRLSQDWPLVLAIEDLHWIDQTSQAFLDYLIGWLANAPILLICLYRPEYTHTWGSKSYYTKIRVNQLSTGTSAELVQSILAGAEVAPELRDLILNRSAGIPLFMEEFTHSLLENGSIEKTDNRYILTPKAANISIPDTIEGIIAARIDRLEENLKRTMQVASVIGREFAFRILQTITGMKEDLKSHLINLQGLEFIYEKRLFPELEYIFKHILTQEVAYNSLLVRRRKEIHEHIGRAIEQVYTERLEEFYEMLAYHFLKAESFERAAYYLSHAGTKATRKNALAEAFDFYKEAIKALEHLSQNQEAKKKKLETIFLMTTPMRMLGFPEGSLDILGESESIANDLGDKKSIALSFGKTAIYYSHKGQQAKGVEYAEKAFAEATEIGDLDLIAPLGLNLGNAYINTMNFSKVVEVSSSVAELIENAKRESDFFDMPMNVYSALCAYCCWAMGNLGNFREGALFCEKALRKANELNDPRTLGYVELYVGMFFLTKTSYKSAATHYQNCIRYCEEVDWRYALSLAWSGLGSSSLAAQGDPGTARDSVQKGLAIAQEAGIESFLSYHYALLSRTYLASHDIDIALDLMTKGLEFAEMKNEKVMEGIIKIWLAEIMAKANTFTEYEIEKIARDGIQILEKLQVKSWFSLGYAVLGEFFAGLGRRGKALEYLRKAELMFEETEMDYYLDQTRQALKRL